MQREVYLDNSATTRPFDEVIEYITYINKSMFGNPSSLHLKGIEAERLVKKSREIIAGFLNVEGREVIFTSGGTESNNLAIRGYLNANPRKGNHIITTKIEHPSVLELYKNLSQQGYEVDFVEVDSDGKIRLDILESIIKDTTSLISIIHVNNETGTVQPVKDIVKIKNSINSKAVIHLDAIQAYGKIHVNPEVLGVDMVSVSSHKIHGPKGVGALYVNNKIKFKPIIYGGGQELQLRPGTENTPGICGFGLASELMFKKFNENSVAMHNMKCKLINELKIKFPCIKINSPDDSSPYILNVSFKNIQAEVLLHYLEMYKIYVSTGAACSSRKKLHSHVLNAMGVKTSDIEGAIRFSFSIFNNDDDVEYVVQSINEIFANIPIRIGEKKWKK